MSVQRVQCPNCGRYTIKGKFCIYCGYTLEEPQRQEPEIKVEKPVEHTAPTVEAPQQASQIEQPQGEQAKPEVITMPNVETAAEEVIEDRKLIEQLASVYSWWIRLLELYLDKDASPEIFQELYQEYSSRIKSLDARRREEIDRVERRIAELSAELERIKVKHDVGEIPDRQYVTRKIEIDREMNKLRSKLTILQNPLNLRLAEIPSFKSKIENLTSRFSVDNIGELNLSEEFLKMINDDLNRVISDLQALVEQHNRIRKELDKLELRYKIGELSKEEYLVQKQKIERQLEST